MVNNITRLTSLFYVAYNQCNVNLSSNHSLLQLRDDLTKAHSQKKHNRCNNVPNNKHQRIS